MTDSVNDDVKREIEAARGLANGDSDPPASTTDRVLLKVRMRRRDDDQRDGFFRDFPDGTAGRRFCGPGVQTDRDAVVEAQRALGDAMRSASPSWRHHLELAMARVMAEADEAQLEERLVAVAAVAVAWAEGIEMRVDRRRIDVEAARSRKLRVVALDGGGEMVLREYSVPVERAAWWKRLLAWFSPR